MSAWEKEPRVDPVTDDTRAMLRSAFVSLFWNVISHKKDHGGFSFTKFAERLGVNKSAPSRWFSAERPNWTINTISDIEQALDLDIEIWARDRKTGIVFSPAGIIRKSPVGTFTDCPSSNAPPRINAMGEVIEGTFSSGSLMESSQMGAIL